MVHDEPFVDPDELIRDLRDLAAQLGRTPTKMDMEEHGPHSTMRYAREFGSWNEALRAARLEPVREKNIPTDVLADELREFADELGRIPRQRDMWRNGPYTYKLYERQFGSWPAALEAAGLDPDDNRWLRKRDRETLLDDLRDLADELGHSPSAAEMDRYGRHNWKTYVAEFGTWNEAKDAADLPTYDPLPARTATGDTSSYNRYYGANWPRRRERARRRDQYRCRDCSKTAAENHREKGTELPVHHIVPFERFELEAEAEGRDIDYDAANALPNLVTLCQTCHWRWEGTPYFPR